MRVGRTLLAALLVASLVAVVAQPPVTSPAEEPPRTAVADHHETASYVVEQNGVCRPIEPFESGGTVASFYDYRSNATTGPASQPGRSSYGTEAFQSVNGSVLFLHEGSDGLSLGVVHGSVNGSGDDGRANGSADGGRTTMEFVGLPADAEWAVRDDAAGRSDNFTRGDGWARGAWSWRAGRTDGGALNGGLGGRFAVTIDPGVGVDRGVESLAVASDDGLSANRTSLPSLDAPLTIRTGTCDGASVSYDRTGDGIEASIEGARADHPVALTPPAGPSDNVTLERVTVQDANGSFALGFGGTDSGVPTRGVDGADPLTALSMSGDLPDGSNVSVTFSVSKEAFDPSARDDTAIVLYERAGQWRPTATALVEETSSAYRFRANVSSLSEIAVAPRQSLDVVDVTLSDTRIQEGETVDVRVTVENDGQFAGERTIPLRVFGERVDARVVSTAPGANRTIEYEQQFAAPGNYTVEVRDEQATVTVEARSDGNPNGTEPGDGPEDDGDDALPGFGPAIAVAALSVLAAMSIARRRDQD
jgi:hypothetical protein